MLGHQKGGFSVAGVETMLGTLVADEVRDNGGERSKS